MTTNENTKVHVRASELAASVAVDGSKAAMVIRTHMSHDADGFSNKVAVKDIMWTAGEVPSLVFVLENGQEFEAEVRPSSPMIRAAKWALELSTQAAERVQDEARNAAKEV